MFTPLETASGALLLFAASSTLLSDTGRVLGVSGFIEGALWSAPREKRIRADDISGTATPAVLPPTSSTRIENGENGRGESNGHANGSNGAAVDESKALIDRVDSVGRVGETVGGWRRAVLQGMLLAPLVGNVTGLVGVMPDQGLGVWEKMSPGRLAVAGLLVGLGSRVSNGVSSWLGCLIHSLTLRSSGLVAPGTLQTLPPHLMLSSRLKPPRSLRSGHMLCGLSRIHPRSVAATFTFFHRGAHRQPRPCLTPSARSVPGQL
jgi:hypothetical protein